MVRVLPLRALRYSPAQDLRAVTTPPHDVVTPARKQEARHEPHSIVHLVLPEEGGEEGRFQVAARRLAEWQAEGVLRRDGEPAFYRYEVTHGPPEGRRTLRAFFARVGLDATHATVRPHERTLARKKGDRLRLRQATQCDVEPIWLLYRDADARVDALLQPTGAPVAAFTDMDGAEHRLWRVTDPDIHREVTQWFEGRSTVIADGHHRYESALGHFAATGRPEDASILACLSRDGDPGIQVEATHRLVRWGRTLSEAVAAARSAWQLRELPPPRAPDGLWSHAARELLQSLDGAGTAVVVGRDESGLRAYAAWVQDPIASQDLAVALVQDRLLADCWGLDDSAAGAIAYERDTAECLRAVGEAGADLAVLLPGERVESVLDAAALSHLMPAKATYFVPKPASGVVLAPLDEA